MHKFTFLKKVPPRYAVFFAIIIFAFTAVAAAKGAHVKTEEIRLYFVDAEMLRLVPVKMTVPSIPTRQMARRALSELIEGRDDNPKIRRVIPCEKRGMSVSVKGETAYVDIKRALISEMPEGRDLEILFVYQIVNTLTELDGIKTVRFTIEGEKKRDFMGYLDMRETFVPDYFV